MCWSASFRVRALFFGKACWYFTGAAGAVARGCSPPQLRHLDFTLERAIQVASFLRLPFFDVSGPVHTDNETDNAPITKKLAFGSILDGSPFLVSWP